MFNCAFRRLTALAAALLGSAGCLLAQQLTGGSVGSIDANGAVAFSLTFDRVPDFKTVDAGNRQATDFQFYIGTSTAVPTTPYASLVRGGEIHVAGDLPVRNGSPPDSDPNSGGWGSIRGRVSFVLDGQTLTFLIPAAVLNVSGPFGYRLDLGSYGGTTASYSGVSGGPIKVVADPPVFSNLFAPESIAGKVYRDINFLGHTASENTIIFGTDGRYVFLKHAFVNSPLGLAVPILAPLSDGRYKYSRTSDTEATVELDGDDGTVSNFSMVFTSPTGGRGPTPLFLNFFFTDVSPSQSVPARNISMRSHVGPGQPVIVGLIIPEVTPAGGPQDPPRTREVMIRAVGPSLLQFGITNPWADPDFQVFKGAQLARLDESHNADWEGVVGFNTSPDTGKGLRKIFSYVGAFPLVAGSKDAVDVLRLAAGDYTIVCNTKDSDPGGDVLIEVYFLP